MPNSKVMMPPPVLELVRERILALEQLEILLLLQQRPLTSWSIEELATNLMFSVVSVEAAVAHLLHHELIRLESPRRYCFAPRDVPLAEAVAALASTYVNARVEVLALISSDALLRTRHRARQLMRRLSERPASGD